MRGAKGKIHFLPEFCKVVSEPQSIYTAAHSLSSTFTASFLWRSASFEPHAFPSHNYLHCPKGCLPALTTLSNQHSHQGSSFFTPRTRQAGTSLLQCNLLLKVGPDSFWITQNTWHCLQIFFCFASAPIRKLSLPSSHKLTWDLNCGSPCPSPTARTFLHLNTILFSPLRSPFLYSPVLSPAAHLLLSALSLILSILCP